MTIIPTLQVALHILCPYPLQLFQEITLQIQFHSFLSFWTLPCFDWYLIIPWAFQSIQRRLEEIEVTFRELEKKGKKLEQALRDEGGKSLDYQRGCSRDYSRWDSIGYTPTSVLASCCNFLLPLFSRNRIWTKETMDEPVALLGPKEEQSDVWGVWPHDCVRNILLSAHHGYSDLLLRLRQWQWNWSSSFLPCPRPHNTPTYQCQPWECCVYLDVRWRQCEARASPNTAVRLQGTMLSYHQNSIRTQL